MKAYLENQKKQAQSHEKLATSVSRLEVAYGNMARAYVDLQADFHKEKEKNKKKSKFMIKMWRASGSYTVYCDASRIGIGFMLMPEGRVIAYASRQWNPHEKNYLVHDLMLSSESTTLGKAKGSELEAAEVVRAIKGPYITILYHPGKANVVVDAFSRKAETMGSLSYIPVGERPLAFDVQTLANQFVRLDVLETCRVLAHMVYQSSLYECIKSRQYDDSHLLVLKDMVQQSDTKEVSIGDDGVFRM
ncbi:uncharacterized protein [Nicotiana tomentosiformis]|uniref:uncharacterized protein n=1 Tax=Nicotiana tomentosiformis TaxID=4098 RepID=UPI00388C3BAB